jgi:hypothetical protein
MLLKINQRQKIVKFKNCIDRKDFFLFALFAKQIRRLTFTGSSFSRAARPYDLKNKI